MDANNIISYIKGKAVTGILIILAFVGSKIWDYTQKGAEADINAIIDKRIENKLNDNQLVQQLLNSKKVKEFTDNAGKQIKDAIAKDIMRKDTNKVSMRSIIGVEANLRDENVPYDLGKMLKDYKAGLLFCNDRQGVVNPIRL
jgi:hypothetical protein